MSRISPFHFNVNEYDNEELENICPRYLKWLKKVKAFDFSKRKKGKIERTVLSFDYRYKLGESSRPTKRSKSFLSKIRRGGQNLRVRVRTSADLWRRWIRGGIMYSTEISEKDEQEYEEREKQAVKDVPKLNPINEDVKESKQIEMTKTDVIIEVTEIEKIDEIENKNSEISVKTIDNENSEENKTKNIETVSEKSDTQHIQSSNPKITTEEDEKEVTDKVIVTEESVVNQKIVSVDEQVVDQKTNANIENSTLNANPSKDNMPEVVANND